MNDMCFSFLSRAESDNGMRYAISIPVMSAVMLLCMFGCPDCRCASEEALCGEASQW